MDRTVAQTIATQVATVGVAELEKAIAQEIPKVPLEDVIIELEKFEKMYTQYRSMLVAKRKAKQLQSSNLAALRTQIEQEQQIVYEQFFIFQNKFNAYFGRKIQMLFVIPKDGIKLALADNDLKHVVVNQYGSLEYQINDLSLTLLKENEYDSSLLDDTANSVYARWDAAKAKLKKSVGLPILWRTSNGWDGRKVNNRGTIAEAYANFYINQVELQGDLEYRVGTYVCDGVYGMMSVDNTMGFALGDIDRGHVQYAVKSQRAGLMGMHRVYQYIRSIRKMLGQNITDKALVSQLMEKVSQKGKVKQVTNLVATNIEQEYSHLIADLLY